MPILGIYASSAQPALNATSFDSIATITVGAGGAANITFSSIPSTYKHLQIRGISRTDRVSNTDNIHIFLNSDTGSNYAWHQLVGDGSTAAAGGGSSTNVNYAAATTLGSTGLANAFGASVIDILDYTNTSKYTTVRSLLGKDSNGGGEVGLRSALWQNTNAVTTVTLIAQTSANISQYSSFALYGIK